MGDDLGVTPIRGKAVNLAEARAMQDARAAAGAWDDDNVHAHMDKSGRKKKRRSRGRSLPARREPHAMAGSARKARSVAGTPRRASRSRHSLEARKLTEDIFNSEDEDAEDYAEDRDDDMPRLDGSSSEEDAARAANPESKTPEQEKDEKRAEDRRLSVIATPASQRAQWDTDDDEFIATDGTVRDPNSILVQPRRRRRLRAESNRR